MIADPFSCLHGDAENFTLNSSNSSPETMFIPTKHHGPQGVGPGNLNHFLIKNFNYHLFNLPTFQFCVLTSPFLNQTSCSCAFQTKVVPENLTDIMFPFKETLNYMTSYTHTPKLPCILLSHVHQIWLKRAQIEDPMRDNSLISEQMF